MPARASSSVRRGEVEAKTSGKEGALMPSATLHDGDHLVGVDDGVAIVRCFVAIVTRLFLEHGRAFADDFRAVFFADDVGTGFA
jgi:hypothetical protein